jgi:putative ABC transport system permease protein
MKSRLRIVDVLRLAGVGLGSRPGRSSLTALGIAIGIAAIVAVVGISASGRAELIATLDRLGTNLLRVSPSQGILGAPAAFPDEARAMASRIAPVQAVTTVALLDATVRRTDHIPAIRSNGLGVMAVDSDLGEVLGAQMTEGRFLEGAEGLPVTVLGRVAAERLGIADLSHQRLLFVNGHWFTVIGILDELELHPDLERSAMVGFPVARQLLDSDPATSAIYLRVVPEASGEVVGVLPQSVNPQHPDQVEVSRPSDALAARRAADDALTQLLVGLGSVALLVGAVAIANVMVMSVLERRMEIGVRRALGATRFHIGIQFLVEAIVLAGVGGVIGTGLGAAVTLGFVTLRDSQLSIPLLAVAGAVGAALLIGALAGLYPAIRAARVEPAEAVRSA